MAHFSETADKDEQENGSVFRPKFDEKGLVSVIAVDHHSGSVLMLAHMNALALEKTLDTGIAHYWSRSRNSIWLKGETSGNTQSVVEILTDCDQDALLLRVTQSGAEAACHTGRASCFYRQIIFEEHGNTQLKTIGGDPKFDPKKVYEH